MNLVDLHTHSTASDGSMQPAELVGYARDKGLKAIALTDHDTIKGLDEAISEGKRIGIEVIPGIEISADFTPEMHVLGYFTNENYFNIQTMLTRLLKNRDERNPKIIQKLNELGYKISMKDVLFQAKGEVIGRPHIAKALVDKGYFQSVEEVFDRLLSNGKPAYFKRENPSPEECVAEITNAGGIPVLAHPIYLDMEYNDLDILFAKLKLAGLVGVEALYVDNTVEQTEMLLSLAKKHRLIVTGGSDFHGSFKKDIDIGSGRGDLRVPYDLLESLKRQFPGAM